MRKWVKNLCSIHAKSFQNVSFQLHKGEILGFGGLVGAQRTELMEGIFGIRGIASGEIYMHGKKVKIKHPIDAMNAGIGLITEDRRGNGIFGCLSIKDNVGVSIYNKYLNAGFVLNHKKINEIVTSSIKKLSIKTPSMKEHISNLSGGNQQKVIVARWLANDPDVLIMDEPTASLSKRECEELYQITEHLRDEGVSIIFITHKFEDMYRLATRVTVFRDSKYIGCWDVDKISNQKLIGAMVGRELTQMYPSKKARIGDTVLRINNISKEGYFKQVSFDVKKGEILGLTGLVGAGRTEVCQSIFGIMTPDSGTIELEGKQVSIKNPIDALQLGIGLLPEDRQTQGLINELPIYQNVSSANMNSFIKAGKLDVNAEEQKAIELCQKIQLKAKDISAPPSSLSGGNQQKVVFAKLLNCDLKVLILDEPTKGIDVGAKYSIYEIMNELTANGYAIIMVSSEMPEVLGMADRIVVMRSGRVVGQFDTQGTTQEMILEASLKHESDRREG